MSSQEEQIQECYQGHQNKLYYSGFLYCRPRTAKQKGKAFDRVYVELTGTQLAYWSAGHCDTDQGSIFRIKNANDPTIAALRTCEAGFMEEERERKKQSFCFCFKMSVPKEEFELRINGMDEHWLEFQFVNYIACCKFFTAAQLAICEFNWLRSFYGNALCASSATSTPSTDAGAVFFVKTPSNQDWHQFYLSISPLKKSSRFNLEIYADESHRQLVGTVTDFSNALPSISQTPEGMYSLNLERVHYRKGPQPKFASKLKLNAKATQVTLAVSCREELVCFMLALRKNFPTSLPKLLPETLPFDSQKLFLSIYECAVDVMFLEQPQINRTFFTLNKAKAASPPPSASVVQRGSGATPRGQPLQNSSSQQGMAVARRRSIYALDSMNDPSTATPRRKSRISIYFKDNDKLGLKPSLSAGMLDGSTSLHGHHQFQPMRSSSSLRI